MKLWVLKYVIGDLPIFLTPDNAHSIYLKDALKFESEDNCRNYLSVKNNIFEFEPSLEIIPDYKDNCLQRD